MREGREAEIYFLIFAKQKQQSNGVSVWLVCRKTELEWLAFSMLSYCLAENYGYSL